MTRDASNTCGGRRAEVLVIGAGQAGLAAANELKKAGIDYLLVDAAAAIGDSWRQRYDTLTLFTPRSVSSLPGLPLPGDPEGYATKDQFAAYLARYAKMGGHRIETRTRISSLRREQGAFKAVSDDGRLYSASAVIVATGPFSIPRMPSIADRFPDEIQQMHVTDFKKAGSVSEDPVLVVGDGASGRDIALALATSQSFLQEDEAASSFLGKSWGGVPGGGSSALGCWVQSRMVSLGGGCAGSIRSPIEATTTPRWSERASS